MLSPKRKDIFKAVANLFHERDSLQTQERSRFDDEVLGVTGQLLEGLEQQRQVRGVLIQQPDAILKKKFRKKDLHSKANARALTAAEMGEQDLQRRERKEEKKQRPVTPNLLSDSEEREICIPATFKARQAGLPSLGYLQVESENQHHVPYIQLA